MIDLKIKVTGKVQGVWFRARTKEEADKLSLNGFVKNLDDGSVYLEVSGEPGKEYKLVQWLPNGSELSEVEQVCIKKNNITYKDGFVIKR